jgi:serine/threonine-protein kinase
MDRKVAVKLLKPHLSTDETALQRFAREARSTMKVDSNHAVKVLDFGITPQKDYYMVLEYLDGRTVQRELDIDGPFAPARVIHIARHALLALGAAHDKGLVHRDIKPDNILLMRVDDDPDFAKVLDFGVAKLMDGAATSSMSALAITQAGMVFGTPEFMSPEQACGQPLDGRSDLYSLAATMFAMVTGCGMYKASAPIEWLSHHARTPPPHLVDGLPSLAPFHALDEALQRCLAKRAADRPQTAADMLALLDAVDASQHRANTPVIDLGATLAPGDAAGSLARLPRQSEAASSFVPSLSSELAAPTTSGVVAHVHGGRRTIWLLLGASMVAAMIVIAIVAATRTRPSRDAMIAAKRSESRATDLIDSAGAVAASDAGPPGADPSRPPQPGGGEGPNLKDAGVGTAGSMQPSPDPAVDAGVAAAWSKRPSPDPVVAAHVAAAEAAKRGGNRLRQLAEADAALQVEPRNERALLLFADALIASGDLDRGCKYLRGLRRNPTAALRARQAGCPTN